MSRKCLVNLSKSTLGRLGRYTFWDAIVTVWVARETPAVMTTWWPAVAKATASSMAACWPWVVTMFSVGWSVPVVFFGGFYPFVHVLMMYAKQLGT